MCVYSYSPFIYYLDTLLYSVTLTKHELEVKDSHYEASTNLNSLKIQVINEMSLLEGGCSVLETQQRPRLVGHRSGGR